jgi:hypothetical protein
MLSVSLYLAHTLKAGVEFLLKKVYLFSILFSISEIFRPRNWKVCQVLCLQLQFPQLQSAFELCYLKSHIQS